MTAVRSSFEVTRNERGVALITAMLVLVVISLISSLFIMSLNTETVLSGHNLRENQALNVAEAGVAEAIARIRSGDVPNNLNPRMVAQIFNTVPGSVPVMGADTVGLATGQTEPWLNYSTAGRHADALTIRYKTDEAQTVIYRYDSTKNPPVQTASGIPIFQILSTGRRGEDRRQISTTVYSKPLSANVYAALCANVSIKLSGSSVVCGYNHRSDTPAGKGDNGRLLAGGCLEGPTASPPQWETGAGNLPGVWTPMTITVGGASVQYGTPPIVPGAGTPFFAGPWECLGVSQAEFNQWIGAPLTSEPADPKGILYLDDDSTVQNQSGDFAYNGGNGEGLLYVDGDLAINGNFTYRGLIYVEGDLKINGTCWILGALIVRGKTEIKIANGNCTVLYSRDAIVENIAKYGGQYVNLTWREVL